MAIYTSEQRADAAEKVKSGELGVNAASRTFGVPSRTIRRDVKNSKNGVSKRKPGPPPTLSIEEEDAIVAGLIQRARKGFPATRLHLKSIVIDVISDGRQSHFPQSGPSRQWITGFLKRHKEKISMRKGRILDSLRVNSVCEDEILMFFAEYEDFLNQHNLDATCIYNCDETGIDPQGGCPVKVIAARGAKNVSVRRGATRENTSVLMTVSAAGVCLPPLFIFKGIRLPSNLLHGAPPGSAVTVSESAFIDTDIFDKWIDHFVAHIPPRRPVLLTLDNHTSHVAMGVRKKCLDNDIHLLSFPPHMTHILQPLDAGCFRSFKSQWRKVVADWAKATKGHNIERKFRAKLVGDAMATSLVPVVIQKSWKSTGMWPLDPASLQLDVVTQDTVDTSRFTQHALRASLKTLASGT